MTKRDIELSKTQIKLALLELTNEPESKQMWSQDILEFCESELRRLESE